MWSSRIRGRILATYGPFRICELVHPDWHIPLGLAEIDYVPPAGERVAGQPFLVVARITPRYANDLAMVLRHIRAWLNGKGAGLRGYEERLALLIEERSTDPQAVDDLRIRDLQSTIEIISLEYDVLKQALLELEGQHPEIDLGPIESTTSSYPPGFFKPAASPQADRQEAEADNHQNAQEESER